MTVSPAIRTVLQRSVGLAPESLGERAIQTAIDRRLTALGLTSPTDLNLFSVPSRLAVDGDPWATIDDVHHSLQPLLDLWDEHPVELNYPPDHPKMPGEPPRVQPSKKVESHWDADGNRVEGT
jgi:hypothetical protein